MTELPSPAGQPVILENYFTREEANLMSYYAKKIQKPSQVPHMDGSFGYETSIEADQLSIENPLAALTGDPEDDASILKATQGVLDVKEEMEKFFGIELSLANCNYAAMLTGASNPLHADSSELDGTPYHDDEEIEYSGLIYLNDSGADYEGGDIVFPLQDVRISPKAGTVVFFKGDKHHPHGVELVTSGERRTLVLFFAIRGNVSGTPLFSDKHSGVLKNLKEEENF
jgi:hypothetical protein